ncbi:MAG: hypothetical protein L3J42_07745 [Hydrogenimonas sp.]|nr:hypothetical protein [Hydrogenimonas sp.]
MAKVTVSDFIIALLDLLEAESRALQESAELFMERQRESFKETLFKGGWMVGFIAAAIVSLLGAVGFLSWGLYRLFAIYISQSAAPFAVGMLLLLFAFLFAVLASKQRG